MSGWDAHQFTSTAGVRVHAAVLGQSLRRHAYRRGW